MYTVVRLVCILHFVWLRCGVPFYFDEVIIFSYSYLECLYAFSPNEPGKPAESIYCVRLCAQCSSFELAMVMAGEVSGGGLPEDVIFARGANG